MNCVGQLRCQVVKEKYIRGNISLNSRLLGVCSQNELSLPIFAKVVTFFNLIAIKKGTKSIRSFMKYGTIPEILFFTGGFKRISH